MNIFTANIQREWLARIIDGSKKIEYRDATEYWMRRLEKAGPPPFLLRLINGMRPDSPEATVLVDKVDIDLPGGQIRLHIERVVSVIRWNEQWHKLYPPVPPPRSLDPAGLLGGEHPSTEIVIEVPADVLRTVSTPGSHRFAVSVDDDLCYDLNEAGPDPFKVKLISGGQSVEVIAYELLWDFFGEQLTAAVLSV